MARRAERVPRGHRGPSGVHVKTAAAQPCPSEGFLHAPIPSPSAEQAIRRGGGGGPAAPAQVWQRMASSLEDGLRPVQEACQPPSSKDIEMEP